LSPVCGDKCVRLAPRDPLDRELKRLQLFLDVLQFAQRQRLGTEALLLYLGDFGSEEPLGDIPAPVPFAAGKPAGWFSRAERP
jgi:hypothetical protein